MEPHDDTHLAEAVARVLSERLLQDKSVEVPGLGTFERKYVPSRPEVRGGRSFMLPPAEVVTFREAT